MNQVSKRSTPLHDIFLYVLWWGVVTFIVDLGRNTVATRTAYWNVTTTLLLLYVTVPPPSTVVLVNSPLSEPEVKAM